MLPRLYSHRTLRRRAVKQADSVLSQIVSIEQGAKLPIADSSDSDLVVDESAANDGPLDQHAAWGHAASAFPSKDSADQFPSYIMRNIESDSTSPDNSDGDNNILPVEESADDSAATAGLWGSTSPDSSDGDIEEPSFKEELRNWINQSQVPHHHVNSLLRILRPHFPDLPKDVRTLMLTKTVYKLDTVAGGEYYHFGIGECIKQRLIQNRKLMDNEKLSLQINIDGLPLFKSSKLEFWPILGMLHEDTERRPFIIGLWVGVSKPKSATAYLQQFVTEMHTLENDKLDINGKKVEVALLNFVCDAPAKSFVKSVKGHTGYYGCDNCVQEGNWVGRMTFPEVAATPRSDIRFDEMLDEDHHTGDCSLRTLNIGLVTQFPLDYMHLVCLGVVRKLLRIWLMGPLRVRIGSRIMNQVSDALIKFRPYMPREFARKGRSLTELDRWKATELRTFLLYTGPVALKGVISDQMYGHFVTLQLAISILCSPTMCKEHAMYAGDLLVGFVKHFGVMYGPEMWVYNVHSLVHLSSNVQRFGPLDVFSAFPFENYLKTVKQMVRKPSNTLAQVVRRLSEITHDPKPSSVKRTGCKKEHFSGPLPKNFPNCTQFEECHLERFYLSVKTGDNSIHVNGNIFVTRNIVIVNQVIQLICQKFDSSEAFYHYPTDSRNINIKFVKHLSNNLLVLELTDISEKVVLLPYRNGHVAIPVIHTV